MVSIKDCRRLMGSDCSLTDADIEAMRDQLQVLADVALRAAELRLRSEADARTDAWSRIPAVDVAEVHERAAIMEFDGGLVRIDAERRAMAAYCNRRKELKR